MRNFESSLYKRGELGWWVCSMIAPPALTLSLTLLLQPAVAMQVWHLAPPTLIRQQDQEFMKTREIWVPKILVPKTQWKQDITIGEERSEAREAREAWEGNEAWVATKYLRNMRAPEARKAREARAERGNWEAREARKARDVWQRKAQGAMEAKEAKEARKLRKVWGSRETQEDKMEAPRKRDRLGQGSSGSRRIQRELRTHQCLYNPTGCF